ncbi:UNVERIFIED_CONTAM: Zinc finger BED domain-containing protein RICESLEEPER 1 [Sesamum radiatum]|uniref:Zinc finger BED domain-containing protein RICESLEEPER 1 n=1 Tax=Sesamum radiatum TaxID=300843 RepID=A0AAW2VP33_SESRA
MSNYDGIGSHSQTQSNSSPNVQTVDMDGLNDQVSGDRLENVEHYFEDNIDVELEGGDEEEDIDGLKGKDEHEVISRIRGAIRHWLSSSDVELNEMARKMKEKYDKYWGSIERINMILYYAVILDPRHKLEFLEFTFDKLYGGTEKCDVMKEQVRDGLHELFNDYKLRYGHTLQGTPRSLGSSFSHVSSSSSSSVGTSMQFLDHEATCTFSIEQEFSMYKTGGKGDRVKSELEKYLSEDVEMHRDKFDILNWWKVNTQRFPILSKMARDVLAVPVSTVASESAFSTGGRVLDAFRSSLSPKIVQALICTQDWLRKDSKPISIEEDLSELEVVEKGCVGYPNPTFGYPNPTDTQLAGAIHATLLEYWVSPDFKATTAKNKANPAVASTIYHGRSSSIGIQKQKMKAQLGRPIKQMEVFSICYKKKDGEHWSSLRAEKVVELFLNMLEDQQAQAQNDAQDPPASSQGSVVMTEQQL